MEKIKVEICTGTACHLLGAQDLKEYIVSLPQAQREMIELSGATCFQKCGQGPNVKIDGTLYSNVSVGKLEDLLAIRLNNN